ncbi:MAG: penicillin-binding protein activator LpoB [Verrucomicrobia bacterium]|nr:MAG: penicillin-binding protein activator LpoB [Verrucomicrobiota bacterium]
MKILFLSTTAALGLLLTGCATPQGAKYVDSQGPNTIVSLDQINIQDWNAAADKLVASLLASNVLERAPSLPAVMAVSRIRNNTQQQVDTDSLTKKIRIALNQTGKVVTTTTLGPDGKVEDAMAADVGAMGAFMAGEKQTTTMPFYTLSGKLLEDRARSGGVQQATYTFQLSLTTVKDGLAVWEDETLITKQGRRNSVGW